MVTASNERIDEGQFSNEWQPRINLQFYDLSHEGVKHFLHLIEPDAHGFLAGCVETVKQSLYSEEVRKDWVARRGKGGNNPARMPTIKSITVCVRPMSGVAYTTSAVLDDHHKEVSKKRKALFTYLVLSP